MVQSENTKMGVRDGSADNVQLWATERITPHDTYQHGLVRVLSVARTKYQDMIIADKGTYGCALFLDGKLQVTEGDEMFYHEPLVHIPCLLHGVPKKVLVLGGADGGTAREFLKWTTISRVVLVDIDEEVVSACRKWLSKIHCNCWDDSRLELYVEDALAYVEKCKEKFDVVICDLTDPDDDSPSFHLFTKEFFSKIKACMTDDGIMATLGGTASLVEDPYIFPRVHRTLCAVFSDVRPYQTFVSTFGAPLGFCVASSKRMDVFRDYREFDDAIRAKVKGELQVVDGRVLQGAFCLPVSLKRAIARENIVFSQSSNMSKTVVRASARRS